MNILQFLLAFTILLLGTGLGYAAFAGPSGNKQLNRRLQAVRFRHSENTTDKVEAQLRKAVAANKPTAFTRPSASCSRTR